MTARAERLFYSTRDGIYCRACDTPARVKDNRIYCPKCEPRRESGTARDWRKKADVATAEGRGLLYYEAAIGKYGRSKALARAIRSVMACDRAMQEAYPEMSVFSVNIGLAFIAINKCEGERQRPNPLLLQKRRV